MNVPVVVNQDSRTEWFSWVKLHCCTMALIVSLPQGKQKKNEWYRHIIMLACFSKHSAWQYALPRSTNQLHVLLTSRKMTHLVEGNRALAQLNLLLPIPYLLLVIVVFIRYWDAPGTVADTSKCSLPASEWEWRWLNSSTEHSRVGRCFEGAEVCNHLSARRCLGRWAARWCGCARFRASRWNIGGVSIMTVSACLKVFFRETGPTNLR